MNKLKESLPSTMAGIASKAGLKLAFGKPSTDGKTIWVSDIPLNPTEDDRNLIISDLIHEIGHIKYTDFSLGRGKGLLGSLTNLFEDVRIEKLLQKEFLGAKTFLDNGYKVALKRMGDLSPSSANNSLTLWLLLEYMIRENGRGFWKTDRDKAYQACLTFGLSEKLLNSIKSLCDQRVPNLSSTADVIQLSKEVVALLQQSQEEEQKQQQQSDDSQEESESDESDSSDSGQGENSDSEEGDEADGNGSGSNAGDSDEDGEDGSQGQSSGSQQESESQSQGSSSPGSSESDEEESSTGCSSNGGAKEILESDVDESSPISLRELAQSIIENVENSNSTKSLIGDVNNLAAELRQMNGTGYDGNFYYPGILYEDMENYLRLKEEVSTEILKLKNRLIRKWQNESRTRHFTNEHDGTFSAQEAIRCRISGERNFLIKKSKRINYKPAVCVLADLSLSMEDNEKIRHQAKALIALTESCNVAGIPLNILGFSRYVITVKKWQDPLSKSRALLGGIEKTINDTDLSRAVFEGVRALQSRKESRKILITLTDGVISTFQMEACQNIMDFAQKTIPGIEFYGLGIGVDLGEELFEKGGQIQPEKLSESILEILNK